MSRLVLLNIALNAALTLVFVVLNMWAVSAGLEETFVSFALMYGLLVIMGNAVFVSSVVSSK